MNDLPAPMTQPDCVVGDTPFPHELLVELMANAFGLSEEQSIAQALSLGWVRVHGGWKLGH
jgi:hypothetical protein